MQHHQDAGINFYPNQDQQAQQDNGYNGNNHPENELSGLNNTNCNVTASLNNISNITSGGVTGLAPTPATSNRIALNRNRQQINMLPNTTQKFSQPMKIIKIRR